METVPYRPLGLIKTILEKLGYEISHCYEDLIFVNHNAFLLRMEEKGEDVSVLFNVDCTPAACEEATKSLFDAGREMHLNITPAGTYEIVPDEENATLDIHFNETPVSQP
jgi:hypothetical protein